MKDPSTTKDALNIMQSERQSETRCLQINLQHARAATSQTALYAAEERIDLILGQEPYCRNGKVVGFPLQWSIYQKEDIDQPPRAFIANCNPKWSPLMIAAERDFVAILLEVLNLTVVLVSIYSPPTEEADPTLERIQRLMRSHRIANILFAGDFNAHSTTWGYAITAPKGRILEDFVHSSNLVIHNRSDAPPTFNRLHSRGWPDLTITTQQMAPILQDWTVVENLSISDHNYIRFNLANSTATSILKRYNLPGRKVRAFTAIIRARLAPFATAIRQANSKEALQNLTQDILTAIKKACDENLPPAHGQKNHNAELVEWHASKSTTTVSCSTATPKARAQT
ncbi:uncharacterized protein LOC118186014 [Stegodyphus dumicola]|uniref:uncharacterized protein LOC118186014 n=1 Tax=Stegodyphus dumicola TaxID=202533 RepID=UPI0015B0F0D7|nr:uncharacterized protein LOC118186014 [Stegodyphus dumicola]